MAKKIKQKYAILYYPSTGSILISYRKGRQKFNGDYKFYNIKILKRVIENLSFLLPNMLFPHRSLFHGNIIDRSLNNIEFLDKYSEETAVLYFECKCK